MKGDFSRITFNPAKQFSRVLMQQGRVQLDADWNEQASLVLYQIRKLASAVIGPYGASGDAFKITKAADGSLQVAPGVFYAGGILCESDGQLSLPLPAEAANYLVYLSVRERHITFVNDESIREKALGEGVDTASRSKVVCTLAAVKAEIKNADDLRNALHKLQPNPEHPTMNALLEKPPKPEDICNIPPSSHYRGEGNQLYRVEIHRPADPVNGVKPTFKWSRENGSVVFPVTDAIAGKTVHIQRFNGKTGFTLQHGDWVEFEDDDILASGKFYDLARVESVQGDAVTLDSAPIADFGSKPGLHPLLRRWDHAIGGGVHYVHGTISIENEKHPYPLEQGILVEFQSGGKDRVYLRGDYWVIPARILSGGIEWPHNKYLPAHRPDLAIAPLALITIVEGKLSGDPTDVRSVIQPIAKSIPF